MQGNCANGYGVFIYEDSRIYEGQWKNGVFNGMGALTFDSGTKYTGEFKKGFMHGYGRITLLDGKQHKCTFSNDLIENNDSIKQLWETETKAPIEKHVFYCNLGDAYKKFKNYEKSIEYYNKSLKINPNYKEAINSRNGLKKKLAEQESKLNKTPQIIFHGEPGVEPGTHSRKWIETERIRSEKVNIPNNKSPTYSKYKKTSKYADSTKAGDESKKPDVEVLSHDFKFLSKLGDSWKFQWKVKLINNSNRYAKVYIKFRLLDSNGYEVDWTNDNVTIMPNETQNFRGTSYIEKRLRLKAKKSAVEISVH